jgi:lysozyme family protein
MSDFNIAIETVLRHEGGFVDNVNDPGGATNFGVSARWLQSKGLLEALEEGDKTQDEVKAIRDMTKAQAMGFFKAYWWDFYKYQNFNAQSVATKVFDSAVNMGASRAHKILQGLLGLPQDGVLGPKSFAEANATSPSVLVVKFQQAQADFYRGLVTTNPSLSVFLGGWIARAYDRN